MSKSAHGLLLEELHRQGKAKTLIYEKLFQEWQVLARGSGVIKLELQNWNMCQRGHISISSASGKGNIYFDSVEFSNVCHGNIEFKMTKGWRNFFKNFRAITSIIPPNNGRIEWFIKKEK